jgi:hypothetical protein
MAGTYTTHLEAIEIWPELRGPSPIAAYRSANRLSAARTSVEDSTLAMARRSGTISTSSASVTYDIGLSCVKTDTLIQARARARCELGNTGEALLDCSGLVAIDYQFQPDQAGKMIGNRSIQGPLPSRLRGRPASIDIGKRTPSRTQECWKPSPAEGRSPGSLREISRVELTRHTQGLRS